LPQIIDALGAACRLARELNRGQQYSDQNTDNRNDDKQFDKREAGAAQHCKALLP
jgi:hypothetical protein